MNNYEKNRVFEAIYKLDNGYIVYMGRYHGHTPKQAASKAILPIFKLIQKCGYDLIEIKFSVREISKKSKQKTYFYRASRIKLLTPIIIHMPSNNGVYVTYKYKNSIYKLDAEECNKMKNIENLIVDNTI